jgi:hypothetical protein
MIFYSEFGVDFISQLKDLVKHLDIGGGRNVDRWPSFTRGAQKR